MNKLNFDTATSLASPTYFIADIAANHDGSLERAVELIKLAAESGADAAKFQNFKAETIVSARGFQELGKKITHQAKWEKDVIEVYREAELPLEWTETLVRACEDNGIDYFTAPYDLDFIPQFANFMPFFKVGSGDITWKDSLELIAKQGKPILLATGASELWEVERAVKLLMNFNIPIVLMQCNTNYTGEEGNFDHLNLLALNEFKEKFPGVILGLSDHSVGHIAVLGAVALGARAIEKHFTDDTSRVGPDHGFSLDPIAWKKMVDETRILERSLGNGHKKVEPNEIEARIVQRRALRFRTDLSAGATLRSEDLMALRPCPPDGVDPFEVDNVVGRKLIRGVLRDELVRKTDFEGN
ncbi:SpsE Sialic acid synthase [Candidatus Nanopelagicaceae bacterium]